MSTEAKEKIEDINVVEEKDGSVTVDLPDHMAETMTTTGLKLIRTTAVMMTTPMTLTRSERQGATAAGPRRSTSSVPTRKRTKT